MSTKSPSTGPQSDAPVQVEPSTMSDAETPTKIRFGDTLSQEPARKRQRVSHYAALVDIVDDPKGDLVIKVGQQEDDMGLVGVHKAILMMASAAFRKMLSQLEVNRKYDENDPLVLDDDRTAFIDFCMMIHHQSKDEHAVPLSRSAAMAVIFHKFSCTNMLQQNVSWPRREFFGPSLDQVYLTELKAIGVRLEDALCISYLSGDAKLFYRCSRFMVTRLAAEKTVRNLKTNKALLDLMPKKFLDHMHLLRTYHLNRLENEIYKLISDLHDGAHGSFSFCPRAEHKVMRYTMELCRIKGGVSKLSDSVLAMSAVWSSLGLLAKNIAEIEKGPCSGCRKMCVVPMAEPIARAAAEASGEVGGLCLYCEQEGKSPMDACDHNLTV